MAASPHHILAVVPATRLRQPPSSEGGLRRVKRLRRGYGVGGAEALAKAAGRGPYVAAFAKGTRGTSFASPTDGRGYGPRPAPGATPWRELGQWPTWQIKPQ